MLNTVHPIPFEGNYFALVMAVEILFGTLGRVLMILKVFANKGSVPKRLNEQHGPQGNAQPLFDTPYTETIGYFVAFVLSIWLFVDLFIDNKTICNSFEV